MTSIIANNQMKNSTVKKKTLKKKIFWTVGIFFAIVCIFPFALDYYLQKKLPDLINDKTPYKVELNGFNLSLLKGNLKASDLKITTKNPKDTSVTQINGTIKSINIADVAIMKAIFSKKYHAESFLLTDSNIKVKLAKPKKNKESKNSKLDLHINNVTINNVSADIENFIGKPVFKGKNINVQLKEIKQSDQKSKIPLAFSEFKINADEVKIGVNDNYEIVADKINAANKKLELLQFHLQPLKPTNQYNSKNVFDFSTQNLSAEDFNVSQDSLIVSNITFENPDLKVYSTGKNIVDKTDNPKEIDLKIGLKNIYFKKGKINVFQSNKEKTASVDNFNFNLSDIVFDKNTVKEKIPFRFTKHDIEAENIYFKADPLQAVKIKNISSKDSNITIDGFEMIALGKSSTKDLFNINTKQIKILNNQSKYIGQKLSVKFRGIEVDNPEIKIISAVNKKKQTQKATTPPEFTADIGFLHISNGKISQRVQNLDKMSIGTLDVKLDHIISNTQLLKSSFPFTTQKSDINAENIYLDAGKYYKLKLGQVKNNGKTTEINSFNYLPKYSRAGFSKVIAKEEDLYTITAKKINIKDSKSIFEEHKNIDLNTIDIDGLNCNIYHDLAPPDDIAVRYLFSKKLRDVKIPLFIQKINLKNSILEYEENAENSNIPGKLTFNRFNATISNVNNAKIKGRPTTINTDASFDFYGTAPTKVNWKFDVTDPADKFTIKGNIEKLSAENVNLFVRPYLNITLDGNIDYLKFDYYGSNAGIAGKFYFKYNDMYVNFLNKKGNERKLLSKVANWFVKDESTGEPNHVVIEKKREPERSFFSMLWQGLMEGLKKYLI
ncbi:hypothetical protein [Chryseobacterium luquanense]|uniref:DUF748 domain-containing protein n=1 Tax=Chryseobacterium luquanense TaxID=2983766 RepID=A0ABT3XZ84_9FLAO|nr:hypothetical protein [Chryseobacterium luquanense]MCX8531186.1 hypothetical protein [Chryseobacterium luquanense]